jgi:demethylmenaquinone methyltransferase / 2-methoxy-6-polyprenyl-1,4-benzoquinol methylase
LIQKSRKALVKKFFDNTATSYEKVVGLTTFGRDRYWKDEIIKRIAGCDSVLDLACGTGILTFKIAKKFPKAKITGVDITEGYLEIAKSKLKPYHKISFLLDDAEKLSLDTKFDCIVSSYIPKYCIPDVLIERCLCHLNPHGKIILHDFTYPPSKLVRFLWNLYFVVLQMVGFSAQSWKDVFRDLPKLIRSANWVNEYKDTMERSGLDVKVRYLTLGCSAILAGTKKV